MRKLLIETTLLTFLLTFSGAVLAAAMAETPPVVQAYSCHLKDGNDMDDLASGIKYWQGQVAKIEADSVKNHLSALLYPIVSSVDADFHWLVLNPNMNAFARGDIDYRQSSEGMAADKRLNKISRCTSNMYTLAEVYMGTEPDPADTEGVLEAYGCTLNEGKTMADAVMGEDSWKKNVAAGMKMNVWRLTPAIANTPYDLVYFVGHDDLVEFGATNTALFNSSAAAESQQALADTMDCEGGLYSSQTIHNPPPAM